VTRRSRMRASSTSDDAVLPGVVDFANWRCAILGASCICGAYVQFASTSTALAPPRSRTPVALGVPKPIVCLPSIA